MKRILVRTLTFLLACLFSACNEQSAQFSVTMDEIDVLHEPITLTVTLPNNAKEHEITFAINGTVYSVASMPTVNDPIFLFEDLPDGRYDENLSVHAVRCIRNRRAVCAARGWIGGTVLYSDRWRFFTADSVSGV